MIKCSLFRFGDGEKTKSDRPSRADLDGDRVFLLFFVKTLADKLVKVSIANTSLDLVELEESFSICKERGGCIIFNLGRLRNEKVSDLSSSDGTSSIRSISFHVAGYWVLFKTSTTFNSIYKSPQPRTSSDGMSERLRQNKYFQTKDPQLARRASVEED
ncbi:hypothetical protein D5086_002269 [Populus alba]|uniref:Uncharacterized protein n=1 Tax=Populus alba TaxID=43335 RepID=A0ACC4D1K9_POPAL